MTFADMAVVLSPAQQPDLRAWWDYPGRRLRAFTQLVAQLTPHSAGHPTYEEMVGYYTAVPEPAHFGWFEVVTRGIYRGHRGAAQRLLRRQHPMTYGEVLDALATQRNKRTERTWLAELPLSTQQYVDPEFHPALQDLADEINWDIHEACAAIDDPDTYYPGVDAGIEPVPDAHVVAVVAALQREVGRELRVSRALVEQYGFDVSVPRLPAVQLAALPWRVQRALVERRRLRMQQWGIDHEAWEKQLWSLWDVPEDPDYLPRRGSFQ